MFQIQSSAGKARACSLLLGKLLTPNCIMYAKGGAPPHFTKDTLALPSFKHLKACHVMLPDVFVSPGAAKMRAFPGGMHRFFNMDDYIMYLSLRDPLLNEPGPSNEKSIAITAHTGKHRVTPDLFMEVQTAFRPDVIACMSDEILSSSTVARSKKSVARSLEWLDRCLKLHNAPGAYMDAAAEKADAKADSKSESKSAGAAASSSESKAQQQPKRGKPLLFAVVQGGADVGTRKHCASEMAKRAVDGFVIGGLESGESAQQRREVIDAVIGALPADRPRVLAGQGSPQEVLEAVERGVDLFEASYPYSLTKLGVAATFVLDPTSASSRSSGSSSGSGSGDSKSAAAAAESKKDSSGKDPAAAGSKISLRDKRFARDTSPLLPGCPCFACANHTRAYVHHLLNTHEVCSFVADQSLLAPASAHSERCRILFSFAQMTGDVLLHIHNVHHYLEFFAVRRAARLCCSGAGC